MVTGDEPCETSGVHVEAGTCADMICSAMFSSTMKSMVMGASTPPCAGEYTVSPRTGRSRSGVVDGESLQFRRQSLVRFGERSALQYGVLLILVDGFALLADGMADGYCA